MARNDLNETTAAPVDVPTAGTPRRTVLRGLAGLAVAGGGTTVLTACGSDDDAPTTTGAGAEEPAIDIPAGSPSTSASAEAPKEPPSGSTELAKLADVPVGGAIILTDQKLVLTQPTAGDVKGFSSTCTHSGCPVSQVTGAEIICVCHGSKFAIADGSVLQGPAEEPLASVDVAVEGDAVVST